MLLRTAAPRAHRQRRGLAGVPALAPADRPCRGHSPDGARGAADSRRRPGEGGGHLRGGCRQGGVLLAGRAAGRDLAGGRGRSYRIAVEYGGADPRIALRQQDDLSDAEAEQIIGQVAGGSTPDLPTGSVDERACWRRSRRSPAWSAWTLAEAAGDVTRDWLKPQVRKLEEPRADGQSRDRLRTLAARPGWCWSAHPPSLGLTGDA